jgi:NAD(P)-dependent dehydrogenase (short-subunit alcohol dehydrogenase family)
MQSELLAKQCVVVVGGSAGIGLAIASTAAQAGASVVIAARDASRLRSALAKIGSARTYEVDAADEEALKALFGTIGCVDHLAMTVHESAAGIGVDTRMETMDLEVAHRFFEAKFWNQYRVAKACIPHLAESGSIVFTSGVASRAGMPDHTAIGAVNGAIESCAKQLAKELAPRRVNVVAPGVTTTSTYDRMPEVERQGFFDRVKSTLPVGRLGSPDEVAQAYILAMTCGYLSGAVLDVSGGRLVA